MDEDEEATRFAGRLAMWEVCVWTITCFCALIVFAGIVQHQLDLANQPRTWKPAPARQRYCGVVWHYGCAQRPFTGR
jgi:hypothetical protein